MPARKALQNWWNGFVGTPDEMVPLQNENEVGDEHDDIMKAAVPPKSSATKSLVLSHGTSSTKSPGSDVSTESDDGTKKPFSVAICEFFYPPDLPDEVQLLAWGNMCIPACYLVVGILQGLFRTLLNVYPLALGATEAQQTTLASIATIPAAFKMLYGFTTDNLPILGYRRKPYIFLGWFMASFMMFLLMSSTDLSLPRDSVTGDPIPPQNAPSMTWLGVSFFVFGISMWFADATGDAVVAEKARCEPPDRRGTLQSTCYACRYFGLMASAPLSTYLYAHVGPQVVVQLLMLVPTIMLPLSIILKEERNLPVQSFPDQCREIWEAICSRSVWQPLAFIYCFNLLQIPNGAWRQFLVTVYDFSDEQLNGLLVISYILLYVGIMTYKYCFLHFSWRLVYFGCLVTNAVFSGLQLLLIRGYTFGLSPFLFSLGDDAMSEFIAGIQFLPSTIIFVALTPAGSEGAAYAIFTTMSNSALLTAPQLSSLLLGIWDTSVSAFESGYLDGLFNLSILTTALQLLPVAVLCLMPHDRDGLYALSKKAGSGHPLGGVIFLIVLISSMSWTMAIAILNIVNPGWVGAS